LPALQHQVGAVQNQITTGRTCPVNFLFDIGPEVDTRTDRRAWPVVFPGQSFLWQIIT